MEQRSLLILEFPGSQLLQSQLMHSCNLKLLCSNKHLPKAANTEVEKDLLKLIHEYWLINNDGCSTVCCLGQLGSFGAHDLIHSF